MSANRMKANEGPGTYIDPRSSLRHVNIMNSRYLFARTTFRTGHDLIPRTLQQFQRPLIRGNANYEKRKHLSD